MTEFIAGIQALIIEYGYTDVRNLCITLAIEKFRDIRNYPDSYSEEQMIVDMTKNKSKIAMAAIEIDSKVGAENQLSHSENGISRSYADHLLAYKDVIGFANCI